MSYTVALVFELRREYLAKGFSPEECSELQDDETIDELTSTLQLLGHKVVQVGDIKDLVACLAEGSYREWDFVLTTSEGLYGLARGAQVPALLEAYQIPLVGADAASSVLCHDKAMTKMLLEYHSIPTAPWCLVKSGRHSTDSGISQRIELAKRISTHPKALSTYPLFAKPAAEGTSKGIYPSSKVEQESELEPCVSLLESRCPDQDILIESYLAGREFTVGIIGTGPHARVIGALEFRFHRQDEDGIAKQGTREVDFWTGELKETTDIVEGVRYEEVAADMKCDPEVQAACEVALKAYLALGCRDLGRIDVRSDKKGSGAIPHILEINQRPGIRADWSYFPTLAKNNGLSYADLVKEIVSSVSERILVDRAKKVNGTG
ncbi:hypothetical protein ACLMJK_002770 [Lecanora helva]